MLMNIDPFIQNIFRCWTTLIDLTKNSKQKLTNMIYKPKPNKIRMELDKAADVFDC